MRKTIFPGQIQGLICAPASKSMAQRAIAASLLCNGTSEILLNSSCDDIDTAVNIVQTMGAQVSKEKNKLIIKGGLNLNDNVINCHESGLCARMFSPIAALQPKHVQITGHGSLAKRPMEKIIKALRQHHVTISSTEGRLPISLKGPLRGGQSSVDGKLSSQFLSGLLMALPLTGQASEVRVTKLSSWPYIEMTLSVLAEFGIEINHTNLNVFRISGHQEYKACSYHVEGDWSGAAFLLVAGAIAGEICVTNLNMHSAQADKMILTALRAAGAKTKKNTDTITVTKSNLSGFEFDATDCPDLFPPLVSLAVNSKGTTVLRGVSRLKHKESNRAEALIKVFSGLGADIRQEGNCLIIHGEKKLQGGNAFSYNDHRIAMAAAIAALNSLHEVTILHSGCVRKSYPAFFSDLARLRINDKKDVPLHTNRQPSFLLA
jgi:3-phosphoshikimate 1-carboxyvinyltransferase